MHSGFRTPAHNAGVRRAARDSRHQYGDAADVAIDANGDGRVTLTDEMLVARAVDLQLLDREFLISQGEARSSRTVSTGATRGTIVDRNGQLLAISTPVDSAWADPRELGEFPDRWPELASALQMAAA